jgi:hypothetical protein
MKWSIISKSPSRSRVPYASNIQASHLMSVSAFSARLCPDQLCSFRFVVPQHLSPCPHIWSSSIVMCKYNLIKFVHYFIIIILEAIVYCQRTLKPYLLLSTMIKFWCYLAKDRQFIRRIVGGAVSAQLASNQVAAWCQHRQTWPVTDIHLMRAVPWMFGMDLRQSLELGWTKTAEST